MSHIFDRLGFDRDRLMRELAAIKRQYRRGCSKPKHANAGDYRRELEKLRKAGDAMRDAVSGLSSHTAASISAAFEPECPCPLEQLQDGLSRLSSLEMAISVPRQSRKPESYARNVFILRVAHLYKKQTGGRKATIRSTPDGERYGPFPDFLVAAAEAVGISTRGIVEQAKRLIGKGSI